MDLKNFFFGLLLIILPTIYLIVEFGTHLSEFYKDIAGHQSISKKEKKTRPFVLAQDIKVIIILVFIFGVGLYLIVNELM